MWGWEGLYGRPQGGVSLPDTYICERPSKYHQGDR